ncbi:RNA-directed DNA polymerase [Salegentibacter sp. LM13S]|uniref:RNA-directed DNA polymerase n=1 Tax=Salegentibacter lacus TaxID=2873599 RepID=UPI001CCC18A3|nr:RNA-directed DNA polymerase [Salegentibacter lacus]MBZ9629188.1 RNA-directed DNA polymerase [Salegentibacter lacus]
MNLKRLIERGYFPKELPPPFHSGIFAEKFRYVNTKWSKIINEEKLKQHGESRSAARRRFNDSYGKYNSSQLAIYGLAKGIYSRRKLGIPNPKQFSDLSEAIIDNWKLLRSTYKLSNYSESTPVEIRARRAVRTKSISWDNFKFQLIEKSFDKRVELRLDIAQFYPAIYTHSIPWAILGKTKAKRLFNIASTNQTRWESLLRTNPDAKAYRSADFIDTLVRNCNDRQSVGLCIGPDTSHILAEVIGNRIDFEIDKRLKNITHSGTRYYDDYYIYFNSVSDAENALKIIQQVLYEFQLETNENKVSIKELPFQYIEVWSEDFDKFQFVNVDKFELRNYFSILHNSIQSNKKNSSWVIKYALKTFKTGTTVVELENWDTFLSFLLQTLIIDSSTIDLIFEIIFIYEEYLDSQSKKKIKNVLADIIKDHLVLNHSYEVSWALWIFITFHIKAPKNLIEAVFDSKDSISKILCLHLIKEGLYEGRKPSLKQVESLIKNSSTFGENWLLIYETIAKEWISFTDKNSILNNEFFEIMLEYGISFYDYEKQIRPKVKMEYDFFEGYRMVEVEYDIEEDGWY